MHVEYVCDGAQGPRQSPLESKTGVVIAPSARQLKPWYSARDSQPSRATDEDKGCVHPCINSAYSSCPQNPRPRAKFGSRPAHVHQLGAFPPPSVFVIAAPSVAIPVSRRTCPFRVRADEHDRQHRPECVCAGLEHLRPRNAKREMEGSETPTSMHGGPPEYGWVEMRSARRKEIAEVQRARGGGAGSAKTLG